MYFSLGNSCKITYDKTLQPPNLLTCTQITIYLTLSPPAVKMQWLSVPGVPASCEKFPHSSQLNFWSFESIFNQFSVLLKILNALCVWLQYKHPKSIKRVIRSDKPITLLLLLWSHKCDFGAEPRSRIIATSAVKGLTLIYLIWSISNIR
jgi:hypothetical protein